MFVLIDKIGHKSWCSESKKQLSELSGINYHTLVYYSRKWLYENDRFVFNKTKVYVSRLGGERGHHFKPKQ